MRILLAEDEKDLSKALVTILKHYQYEVDAAFDGQEAYDLAVKGTYDLFIFDIMMPYKDGVSLLKELREIGDQTPALFLSAKSQTDDKVTGLDAGADDYLAKPFEMKELLARVRSLTRRASYHHDMLVIDDVSLDVVNQELKKENAVRLSAKETKLMQYLMQNLHKPLDEDQIYEHLWHDEDKGVVWIYINYLKSKLQSIEAHLEITGKKGGPYCLLKIGDENGS